MNSFDSNLLKVIRKKRKNYLLIDTGKVLTKIDEKYHINNKLKLASSSRNRLGRLIRYLKILVDTKQNKLNRLPMELLYLIFERLDSGSIYTLTTISQYHLSLVAKTYMCDYRSLYYIMHIPKLTLYSYLYMLFMVYNAIDLELIMKKGDIIYRKYNIYIQGDYYFATIDVDMQKRLRKILSPHHRASTRNRQSHLFTMYYIPDELSDLNIYFDSDETHFDDIDIGLTLIEELRDKLKEIIFK